MKQKLIFFCSLLLNIAITGMAQSKENNVDIGLFANGAHGSNTATGAQIEVALRPIVGYAAIPVADDYVVYIKIPSAELTGDEDATVAEVNSGMFGSNTMIPQPK
ncbi:MAG TPA: hypothetical protein VFS31_18265, partial [Chitinophagaceae bacterium]|nr:hypothetical protein [Chitinophagaceae bacterium]